MFATDIFIFGVQVVIRCFFICFGGFSLRTLEQPHRNAAFPPDAGLRSAVHINLV